MDDNIKIEKHYIHLQEARSKCKKYNYTFCNLKYYKYIDLKNSQPGSYSTDCGSVRWTNSIRIVLNTKGYRTH